MLATPIARETKRESAVFDIEEGTEDAPQHRTALAGVPAVRSVEMSASGAHEARPKTIPPDLSDEPETSAVVFVSRPQTIPPDLAGEPESSATVRRAPIFDDPEELRGRPTRNSAPTARAVAIEDIPAPKTRYNAPTVAAPSFSVSELKEVTPPVPNRHNAPTMAAPSFPEKELKEVAPSLSTRGGSTHPPAAPPRTATLRAAAASAQHGQASAASSEDWFSPLRPSVVRRMPIAPSRRFRALNAWQRRLGLVVLAAFLTGGGLLLWKIKSTDSEQRNGLFTDAQSLTVEKVDFSLRSSPEGARVLVEINGATVESLQTPGLLSVEKGSSLRLRFEYQGREPSELSFVATEGKELLVSLAVLPQAPAPAPQPVLVSAPAPKAPNTARPAKPAPPKGLVSAPPLKKNVDPKSRAPLPPSTVLE
jgi:hypothetical protein